MVKVKMDEAIANAIFALANGNPKEWALMQHYIALKLIRTRDQLEVTNSLKLAGYAQGLRFLFELFPRAECKIEGVGFKRDKTIVGEEGFITRPMRDEDMELDQDDDDDGPTG